MHSSLSSLRTRLLLLVAAAYLPAVGLTLWTIARDREEAFDQVRKHLTQLVGAAAHENDLLIASGRRIIGTWAQVPEIINGSRTECEAAFARLSRFAPSAILPTRVNAEGQVDCGGPVPPGGSDLVGDGPIASRILLADSATLGNHLPATADREALAPLSIALRDSTGRFTGVLSVGFRMTWLNRLATNTELPDSVQLSIVDSTGFVLAAIPEMPGVVGTRIPGLNALIEQDRQTLSPESGVVIRRSGNGILRLVAYHQLASSDEHFVRLALTMSPDVAYAAPNERARVRLFFLIVAGAVALVIASGSARKRWCSAMSTRCSPPRSVWAPAISRREPVCRERPEKSVSWPMPRYHGIAARSAAGAHAARRAHGVAGPTRRRRRA